MNNVKKIITKKPVKKKSKSLRYFLAALIVLIIAAGILFFQYVAEGLPSLDELENPKATLASNVYSIDGELIGQFF